MIFETATVNDLPTIHKLAHEIWWPTYSEVISAEQISFMLENMYSEEALLQQMNEGMQFLLVNDEDGPIAFAGHCAEESAYKLHKIYLLPRAQGKGLGKKIIDHVADIARANYFQCLELNVNRNNPAFEFYKKLGFEVYQTVDIPYYEFVLNDYVMRKAL
ncbi:GNAT family N-acetyltransferase [Pedobacter sp. HMF7647]|uniref:GNAT family N-acetyltransferase n=1 Tax=Hufsiella arboris TaxID=2695275 RepID=A0A7K1Y631_9SPHI|nr:GNAT family N-acetyltransferase [Hufsiella arboris]MXV49900.1 GNAT family N-acetyltransferase [Hufsiella arboris]